MSVEMKDSGIDWIGEIPKHWKTEKPKNMFALRKTKGNKDAVLLAATQKYGMYPQNQLEGVVKVSIDTDLQSFKTVHKNDYVISLRSFQGGFEMSDYEGVCTPAYQVFYAKTPINYRYYKFLFKTEDFISKLNSFTIGIREGKNIQYDDFARLTSIPVPPIYEQFRIANFLDNKCAEIDELIALQDQMIAQLTTYKQAVITETVTKGLDPNVKMKDSGVEWIGEIPEHWSLKRIKNESTLNPSINVLVLDDDAIVSYMPMECLRNGIIKQNSGKYSDVKHYTPFQEEDIVLAKVTPCFENGNIAIARNLENKVGFGTSEIFVVRCKESMHNDFLFYYLQSPYVKNMGVSSMTGTGGLKRVNPNVLNSMFLVYPPLSEQQSIANYLDQKCKEIDELISVKKEKIEQLKAYKKSVIYEYVTGKKQVN